MGFCWTSVLIFAIFLQVVLPASVVINRGDNANNDNDEIPTSPRPLGPSIQQQFAQVSSHLDNPKGRPQHPPQLQQRIPRPPQPVDGAEQKKQPEDTDDNENAEEGESFEESQGEGRSLGKKRLVKQGTNFRKDDYIFKQKQAVGCGYYRMRSGQAISIQSTNFNSGGTYRNFEQCSWKFFGQQCRVKASCPSFDLPSTPNCNGDFLKVTDLYSFAHKFCGDSKPMGTYNSTTNNLKVQFRADGQTNDAGQGFICCVTCTGPGKLDPPQLSNSTACLNNFLGRV